MRCRHVKGRFLGLVLGTVGKSELEKAFVNSVKAIGARNYEPTASHSPAPTKAVAS